MVNKLDNYFMSLVLILQLMGSIQLNTMVPSYGTLSDKDYKTNVSFSQIYNMNQFKQALRNILFTIILWNNCCFYFLVNYFIRHPHVLLEIQINSLQPGIVMLFDGWYILK